MRKQNIHNLLDINIMQKTKSLVSFWEQFSVNVMQKTKSLVSAWEQFI